MESCYDIDTDAEWIRSYLIWAIYRLWFTILGLIMYYVLDNGVVIGSYKYLKDAKEVSKGMYEIFYSLR